MPCVKAVARWICNRNSNISQNGTFSWQFWHRKNSEKYRTSNNLPEYKPVLSLLQWCCRLRILKRSSGRLMFESCYWPWRKTILIEKPSLVNNLKKKVQWVAEFLGRTVLSDKVSNAFAGPLKSIHEERQWIYHDFCSGVWHPRVLMDTSFSKEELLALCSLTTFWHPLCLPLVSCKGIRNFPVNKKGHLHFATQISQNSSMKISCPLDMTKGKCWVPPGAHDLNPLESHVT